MWVWYIIVDKKLYVVHTRMTDFYNQMGGFIITRIQMYTSQNIKPIFFVLRVTRFSKIDKESVDMCPYMVTN